MTDALPLIDTFEACLAAAISGVPVVPQTAIVQHDLRDNPFGGLYLTLPTDAGEVWMVYGRSNGALVGCSIWGGNLMQEDAPFTVRWADAAPRALAWLDGLRQHPAAIDSHKAPQADIDAPQVILCPPGQTHPLVAGLSSFTLAGEAREEAPFDDPEGALVFSVNRHPDLTCDDLRSTR
jgi:hypothetical protein